MLLVLGLTVALAACGSGSVRPSNVSMTAAASSTWDIQLVTTGGFTGSGAGGIIVRSDGTAELLDRSRTGQDPSQTAACRVRLSPPELMELAEGVRLANPAAWRDRYVLPSNPHGCCDMLGYQLTLQRTQAEKPERVQTFWFDDGVAQLPPDLAAVRTRLNTLWALVRQRCDPR
jgi:hypothetical protein